MKQADLNRAWDEVAGHIHDPSFTLANVAFTAGYLAGAEKPYGVALVVALAERVFGHDPELIRLKTKLGWAGVLIEA